MRFVPLVLLCLVATSGWAQSEAPIIDPSAGVRADARGPRPTFGDLEWGMAVAVADERMRADGWTRTERDDTHHYYRGTLLGRDAVVVLAVPPGFGLVSVAAYVFTDVDWDTAEAYFWTIHHDLVSKYGPSNRLVDTFLPATHSSDRAKCEALHDAVAVHEISWPDAGLTVRIDRQCDIEVKYRGDDYSEWFQVYNDTQFRDF